MDKTLTLTPTLNSCVVLHTLMHRSFGTLSRAGSMTHAYLHSVFFFPLSGSFSLIPNISYFPLPERATVPPDKHGQHRKCKNSSYRPRNTAYRNPQGTKQGTEYISTD